MIPRSVDVVFHAQEQREGVGARVRRTIGRSEMKSFDPFLLLDEFQAGLPAGFPDHPHRGFTTVTYVLEDSEGSFCHEDFKGHKGTIRAGDLQWMCAGRGILHSEMPVDEKSAHGLQLWINLPKKDKMIEPTYQELLAKDVPKVTKNGVTATVIAGEALGITSPIYSQTPVHYSHFTMEPDSTLEHCAPSTFNTFVYTLKGSAQIGEKENIQAKHVVTTKMDGDMVKIVAGKEGFECVLVSGQPIGEPVAQHGPFVMNTAKEIENTMDDYRMGINGFEGAHTWEH